MTREDIIRIADENGIVIVGEAMFRFAALVAAHERKSWAPRPDGEGGYELHCAQCWEIAMQETEAEAIRARGEK